MLYVMWWEISEIFIPKIIFFTKNNILINYKTTETGQKKIQF